MRTAFPIAIMICSALLVACRVFNKQDSNPTDMEQQRYICQYNSIETPRYTSLPPATPKTELDNSAGW